MEFRHAVNLLTSVAGEGRHTELLALIVGVRTTHADELVPGNTEFLGIATHILAKQALLEVVVTCGHWGVHGIETAGTNQFQSLVEGQSVFLDIVAQALQVAEGSMTLVAMVNILLDAEFLQQQHTSDAEQNLLFQTVLPVTAIEAVGDGLVEVGVHLIVGIEQIEFHTTHIYTPDIGMHLVVGVRHVDDERITLTVELALDGQIVEILRLVVSNLLSVHRQALCEITETIEETDGTHIDVGVGSLLHVVTGKHTQTT